MATEEAWPVEVGMRIGAPQCTTLAAAPSPVAETDRRMPSGQRRWRRDLQALKLREYQVEFY